MLIESGLTVSDSRRSREPVGLEHVSSSLWWPSVPITNSWAAMRVVKDGICGTVHLGGGHVVKAHHRHISSPSAYYQRIPTKWLSSWGSTETKTCLSFPDTTHWLGQWFERKSLKITRTYHHEVKHSISSLLKNFCNDISNKLHFEGIFKIILLCL